jgi:hypothetical protein
VVNQNLRPKNRNGSIGLDCPLKHLQLTPTCISNETKDLLVNVPLNGVQLAAPYGNFATTGHKGLR